MGSLCNVIARYRHPNTNIANFIDKLNEALHSHNLLNATTYILVDTDIDKNKFDRPAASQNYLDTLCSHGLFPLITIPTRVSKTSATIINLILTNDNTHQLYPGVIKTDLSDHYITFVTLCKLTEIANKHPSRKNIGTKKQCPSWPTGREVMTTSSCWVKGCNSTPSPTVQSTPVNRTVERDSAVSGY